MGYYEAIRSAIIMMGGMSFMGWYGCVFTTKRLIQKTGLNKKYWPKRYVMPNKKIRRLYGLKKKEIPKWSYRQFFVSFIFVALFIISLFLLLWLDNKVLVIDFFVNIWCLVTLLDILYLVVCAILYKL